MLKKLICETKESHTKRMREYNQKLRIKAYQKLGEFCWACSATKNLCLHHDYYVEDSVKSNKSNQSSKRLLEAIKHPERFMVLCKKCHMRHHWQEKRDEILNEIPVNLHKFL